MKTVTLRLPEVSYRNLVGLCERYGITMRGIYEATILLTIRDLEDPDRREQTLEIWAAAKALDQSDLMRQPPRRRVNAKLDDDVAEMLNEKCREFGVSKNAALGLITTPWPVEHTEAFRVFRHENWQRVVALARQREFARRPYAGV